MTIRNGDDDVGPPRRTFGGLSPRQRRLLQASARGRAMAASSTSTTNAPLNGSSPAHHRGGGGSAPFMSKSDTPRSDVTMNDKTNDARMVNEKEEERVIMTIRGGGITADDKRLPSSPSVGGSSGASTAALTDSTTSSSSGKIGRTTTTSLTTARVTTSNLRRHYEIITSETNNNKLGMESAAGEEIRGRNGSSSANNRIRSLNNNSDNNNHHHNNNMRINNHHNRGERLTTLTTDRPNFASSTDQQQQFDNNNTQSSLSNDIGNIDAVQNVVDHDDNGATMRYYKIVFQGVVSLLCNINDHAKMTPHNESNCSGIYLTYGEIVATSVPEIIIPLNSYYSTDSDIVDDDDGNDEDHMKEPQKAMFIRVDSILTGGYATDAAVMASQIDESGINLRKINEVGHRCNDSAAKRRCYGYLPLFVNGRSTSEKRPIAVPLSMAASECIRSSCERGSFLYRVIARTPVSVLSGPSINAVQLGMGLMPGSVHEVSLRFSVPLSLLNDDNHYVSETSLIDNDAKTSEVKFLRLGKRRGWVVDRIIDSTDNKLRSAYLMQDVTNERFIPGGYVIGVGTRHIDSTLSMSFEETSSIHSSAMTTVADTSFYSSAHASSVATPTTVKLQRRRNRRRPRADGGMDSTQSLELLKLVRENKCVGESFEEASSITAGDVSSVSIVSGEGGQTSFAHAQPRPNKNVYLMRVIAPLGLQILDAPHFQVTNLIHNSSSPLKINPRNSSPGTSPFARTNAMIAAVSGGENTSKSIVGRTGNRSGSRLLARGQIFEASCRMQISSDSSLYTNGQGLIKLADGSGWAIVPYRDDLMTQLKNYHGNDASWLESSNDIVAYEEIGNATIPTERNPSDRSRDGIIWLRVAHPPGVKVLLAKSKSNLNTNNNNESRTKTNEKGGSHDESPSSSHSEVASSVASSFFDSVWSRVSPLKEKNPQNDAPSQNPNFRQQQQAKRQTIPTIPCGMVVPVEPWDVSTSSNKRFVRLHNGQGWIPQRLGDEVFADEVDTPEVRTGSFWFRVSKRSGLEVYHGPSSYAPIIVSNNGSAFRFECGEFLRVSEIMTVFSKPNLNGSTTNPECYAKLYRRSNTFSGNNDSDQTLLGRFSTLHSFISPGEWVQVHRNGELFLEECSAAPLIERNPDGWQFAVICSSDLQLRSGPSIQAEILGGLNCDAKVFLVTEKVTAPGDPVDWLRLKSGGWLYSVGFDGKPIVQSLSMSSSQRLNTSNNIQSQRMVRKILDKGR